MSRADRWLVVLKISLTGCVPSFPSFVQDFDDDGYSVGEDCDDDDPMVNPGVDECAVRTDEPSDNDCDSYSDGGALPWRDDFDDDAIMGWAASSGSLNAVDEHDGVIEQVNPAALQLVHAASNECWQDVQVEYEIIPGPVAGEVKCTLMLRARGKGEFWEAEPQSYYGMRIHHHSALVDGANNGDWDGYVYNYLYRVDLNGVFMTLAGSYESNGIYDSGHQNALPDAESYTLRFSAWETDDGAATMIDCLYGLDGAEPDTPCIGSDPGPYYDEDPNRPAVGGIGIECDWTNYVFESVKQPEGIALDWVSVEEL